MSQIDWSKHVVEYTEKEGYKKWSIGIPESSLFRVNFINTDGVLLITGDFGRWTASREFHPYLTELTTPYFLEKIRAQSSQQTVRYDPDECVRQLNEKINSLDEYYENGSRNWHEAREYYAGLMNYVDDKYEYFFYALQKPSFIDVDEAVLGDMIEPQLEAVIEAFNEIVRRNKETVK